MGPWTSLVMLSVMAVNTLSLPRPDEYQIPTVGNNRRSQYYVLHDDGSFKYGYDTGDDAFESQKTSSGGDVDGKFGYRDPDGQEIRVQYTSGQGGFVAQGDHIPKVHPDVAAAFAAARSSKPFVDPLAGTVGGDRSYDFNFSGDEHSRNEISDSDGTVRGSYSYVDEFGRTRSYTYRAGKGIGFVIEGDDIPQQVQPLPTHTTSTQFGASSQRVEPPRRTASQAATRAQPSQIKSTSASQRAESSRRVQTPAKTYFPPTQAHSAAASTSSISSSASKFSTVAQQQPSVRSRPATHTTTSTASVRTRPFEAANTRTFQSPSGSYSLAYETSSHSRQESGDDDNNVRGKFSFKADDDGVERSVSYEAGSATGFVASGRHLPIGPIVPGAPTGQVTGRLVPVVQTPFIDPLADGNLDASFNFDFDSDTYSRSETADEDGNVSGTYSVLGEDDILRTYRYRAGKGIGFETEEISAVPAGHRRSQSIASASTRQHTASAVSHGSASRGSTRVAAAPVTTLYTAPQLSSSSAASHSSRLTGQGSHTFSGTRQPTPQFSGSASSGGFKSSQSGEVFPGFTLRQYDATEGRGKYGYVLKFDD